MFYSNFCLGVLVTVTLKSNMELHIDVLHALEQHGPINSNKFESEINMDCFTLKKHLEFLTQNKLVEKQLVNRNKILYRITEHGKKMLKVFQKIADMLKLETQKTPKNEVLIDENKERCN